MEGYSSLNLLSELNNLDPKQKEALLNGVRWVRHNAPEAVLIGGASVAHHISKPRPLTPDFDFIIYEDEIDEIKYLLSPEVLFIAKMELGRDKDIEDALLLLESGVMQRHLHEHNLDFLKDELENMESYKTYIEMM